MGYIKKWYQVLSLGLVFNGVSACLVETPDGEERRLEKGGQIGPAQEGADRGARGTTQHGPGMCQYGIGRGCFDGYVGFKKDFLVSGRSFFNADDFAASFEDLLQVKDSDGSLLNPGRGFSVTFLTPIDQQSFVGGFEYELSGEMQRSGKILEAGNFSVSDLMEGVYQLRIQRPIRFLLVKNDVPAGGDSATDPKLPVAPESKAEVVSKGYCATLFQDSEVEIRKGLRTFERLNDFKLHLSDRECDLKKHQTTLSF